MSGETICGVCGIWLCDTLGVVKGKVLPLSSSVSVVGFVCPVRFCDICGKIVILSSSVSTLGFGLSVARFSLSIFLCLGARSVSVARFCGVCDMSRSISLSVSVVGIGVRLSCLLRCLLSDFQFFSFLGA